MVMKLFFFFLFFQKSQSIELTIPELQCKVNSCNYTFIQSSISMPCTDWIRVFRFNGETYGICHNIEAASISYWDACDLTPGLYTWVIFKNTSFKANKYANPFEFGSKHIHISRGNEITASGEMKIEIITQPNDHIKLSFNLNSGVFHSLLQKYHIPYNQTQQIKQRCAAPDILHYFRNMTDNGCPQNISNISVDISIPIQTYFEEEITTQHIETLCESIQNKQIHGCKVQIEQDDNDDDDDDDDGKCVVVDRLFSFHDVYSNLCNKLLPESVDGLKELAFVDGDYYNNKVTLKTYGGNSCEFTLDWHTKIHFSYGNVQGNDILYCSGGFEHWRFLWNLIFTFESTGDMAQIKTICQQYKDYVKNKWYGRSYGIINDFCSAKDQKTVRQILKGEWMLKFIERGTHKFDREFDFEYFVDYEVDGTRMSWKWRIPPSMTLLANRKQWIEELSMDGHEKLNDIVRFLANGQVQSIYKAEIPLPLSYFLKEVTL
eukprot:423120_1